MAQGVDHVDAILASLFLSWEYDWKTRLIRLLIIPSNLGIIGKQAEEIATAANVAPAGFSVDVADPARCKRRSWRRMPPEQLQ